MKLDADRPGQQPALSHVLEAHQRVPGKAEHDAGEPEGCGCPYRGALAKLCCEHDGTEQEEQPRQHTANDAAPTPVLVDRQARGSHCWSDGLPINNIGTLGAVVAGQADEDVVTM